MDGDSLWLCYPVKMQRRIKMSEFKDVWSTCRIYPSMAIFRRYAAMFRVGISFIFSSIKSRSASVTLNLICTVLFRPSML